MKKIIVAAVILLAMLAPLFANGTKEEGAAFRAETKEKPIRVLAMKGPTAMGMVKLMDRSESGPVGGNNYEFTITGAVDRVVPAIVKGEVDIASLPANLGSVLYNNTKGGVKVLAVNTLGVIYIVSSGEDVSSFADLKGRTIYASGKGATPEYGLNYLLDAHGLEVGKDVRIEWKSEHAECVAAITRDEGGIAMLPQPFVTTAMMKNPKIHIVLDLTKEWERVSENSTMVTGITVVRTEFYNEHKEAIERFMESYRDSARFARENTGEAAGLIAKYNIVPEAVAARALPYCNIVCLSGSEMKEKLSSYLAELYRQNPKAVGGKLPDDAFYATL